MKIESEINTNLENGKKWVDEYNYFLSQAEKRLTQLSKEISLYDLQLQDILHYVEMKKCDAIILSKLMKKIRDIQINRRIAKDEYGALCSIVNLSKKSKYKNNETYVFKTTVVIDLLEDIINE